MAPPGAASRLLVTGLPDDIATEELRIVFGTYGNVAHVSLEGRGSAHVSYDSEKAAADAIQVLHDVYKIRQDAERPIRVRWAPAESAGREDRGGGGGGGGGSWAGGGGGGGQGGGDSGGNRTEDTDHKLFVGGLPNDIAEDELHTVFGTYGQVAKVVLLKPNQTGNRAALVFYQTKQGAEDAIKVLDQQYKIRHDASQPIAVRWGHDKNDKGASGKKEFTSQSNKVFAGNLPADLTEEELKSVFQTYGELTNVVLMAPHERNNKRAALVFYKERESADTAIRLLNDVYKFRVDSEEPIQVKWGKGDSDKGGSWDTGGWGARDARSGWGGGGGGGGGGGSRGDGDWGSSRGGGGWRDSRGSRDDGGGWGGGGGSRGGWDGGGRDGGRDRRDDSRPSGWGGGGGSGGHDRDRGSRGGDPSVSKLYVANLPEDISDEALKYVFSNYGRIIKVHIMSGKVVRGCVSAFVEYSSTHEAETAIATLDNKYEIRTGYGPIAVRHANVSNRSRPY